MTTQYQIDPRRPSFLEAEALDKLLKVFKYKQGWTFRTVDIHGYWHLLIEAWVDDSDAPGKNIKLSFSKRIPEFVRPDFDWHRWLRYVLLEVEEHELDEFFQVNGEKPFDPHRGE